MLPVMTGAYILGGLWTLCLGVMTLAALAEIVLLVTYTSLGTWAFSEVLIMVFTPGAFTVWIYLGWMVTGGTMGNYSTYLICCLCWRMLKGLSWGASSISRILYDSSSSILLLSTWRKLSRLHRMFICSLTMLVVVNLLHFSGVRVDSLMTWHYSSQLRSLWVIFSGGMGSAVLTVGDTASTSF